MVVPLSPLLTDPGLFDTSKVADRLIADSKKWIVFPKSFEPLRQWGILFKEFVFHPVEGSYEWARRLEWISVSSAYEKVEFVLEQLVTLVIVVASSLFFFCYLTFPLKLMVLGVRILLGKLNGRLRKQIVPSRNTPRLEHFGLRLKKNFYCLLKAHAGPFWKIFSPFPIQEMSELDDGICAGESSWFIMLYLELISKGISSDQAVLLAGEEFRNGAPLQSLILQGLYLSPTFGWKAFFISYPAFLVSLVARTPITLVGVAITTAKHFFLNVPKILGFVCFRINRLARITLLMVRYFSNCISSRFMISALSVNNTVDRYYDFEAKLPFTVSSTTWIQLNKRKRSSLLSPLFGGEKRLANDDHTPSLKPGVYDVSYQGEENAHAMTFVLGSSNEKSYFFDPNYGVRSLVKKDPINELVKEIFYRYPIADTLTFRRCEKTTWANFFPNLVIHPVKLPFRILSSFVKEFYDSLTSKLDSQGNMYFKAW
jgi:hypothetical protein